MAISVIEAPVSTVGDEANKVVINGVVWAMISGHRSKKSAISAAERFLRQTSAFNVRVARTHTPRGRGLGVWVAVIRLKRAE